MHAFLGDTVPLVALDTFAYYAVPYYRPQTSIGRDGWSHDLGVMLKALYHPRGFTR